MDPSTPEARPSKNSAAEVERITNEVLQNLAKEIAARIQQINTDETLNAEQKTQQLQEVAKDARTAWLEAKTAQDNIQQQMKAGQEVSTEAQNQAKTEFLKRTAEVMLADKKGLDVIKDDKARLVFKDIVGQATTVEQIQRVLDAFHEELLGDKPIQIGKKGGEKTELDKKIDMYKETDPEVAKRMVKALAENAEQYGKSSDDVNEYYKEVVQPVDQTPESKKPQSLDEKDLPIQEWLEDSTNPRGALNKFSKEQKEFLRIFYSPELFNDYLTAEYQRFVELETKGDGHHHAHHIRDKILGAYKRLGKTAPGDAELQKIIDQEIRIEISEGLGVKMNDVLNSLYYSVTIERPHKFFEEVEKEDFMHGIEPIRNHIKSKLSRLQSDLQTLEKSGKGLDFQLLKHEEERYETYEIDQNGKRVPVMKISPLPYFSDITLSNFMESYIVNFNHWRHRAEYLHNGRAIFNHPAHGEEGFYGKLAQYAENVSGTDLDEMMLLPDGQMMLDAYMLYDKFVEKQFASQSWTHRTNQFTNKLERVNTQLEEDVMNRLRVIYPKATDNELRVAINNAVGMARAVFLTEPEKSAMADAFDISRGHGLFASYTTNDATALQVFNPLHVGLRWGGEHLIPMFYFMPMDGNKGMWSHETMWQNMGKFMNSFYEGRAGLKDNLFIDQMINIAGVGGILRRRGWRMIYSLDGHNVYDEASGGLKKLNYLETLKAMETIGYEAFYDFLTSKIGDASRSQKDEMYAYLFDRYFKPLGVTDYQSYRESLKAKAEANVKEHVEKGGSITSYKEAVESEIDIIFANNAIAREIALRFPSKYLSIDRGRYTESGISRWEVIQQKMGMSRDEFNTLMKDFAFVETLLRREISQYAKDNLKLFKGSRLGNFTDYDLHLNESKIRSLLAQYKDHGFSEQRVEQLIGLYKNMQDEYINTKWLDEYGFASTKKYQFTFGIEDTDFSLMSMRGTGPRMIARSIGDIGGIEKAITGGLLNLPKTLNSMAINGKHDFSPVIEYLQKAQGALTAVHGTGADFAFTYKIASAVINYFKKDAMAKPLFGAFRWGRRNSIAAEVAGRSSAVWEWDSRDIDRFVTALESYRLIPHNPYDLEKTAKGKYAGGVRENIWVINPFTGKPVKTIFTRRKIDPGREFNGAKLRKEMGGDLKAMAFDAINQWLPILLLFIAYEYLKKAFEEMEGKKK